MCIFQGCTSELIHPVSGKGWDQEPECSSQAELILPVWPSAMVVLDAAMHPMTSSQDACAGDRIPATWYPSQQWPWG